ncbi:flagellar motor protein [Paenibacillus sp. PsM32]|uniref:Flagellar motor protein n=1 Tax=Paenibacillus kyungheensis TaxID=1452732 RepID=A0AAX3LZA8_9BACL|nr:MULTISPECIES: flagellar motor protein [Paenibacillus]MDN4620669.1 flagellar motor protein [Paenibacillus sp. PsM32]MDQ1235836.1 chemotaxis protein MotA [Paenibacillus sp. SORGH_AS_0306]MDR6112887.1 chemotaxis protein MotA [Paenibacillus sp. SORGH_AS_0338]WCT55329.1 flagellar motor protein [Paenibacillus kyungheensis]
MDLTTIIGIIAGLAALIGGFLWEGGDASGLVQGAAALIVFGGTAAAVVISFPLARLKKIPRAIAFTFSTGGTDNEQLIEDIVNMSTHARRAGVLALEPQASSHDNPFLREGIQQVVDGTDREVIQQILELEMTKTELEHEQYAKVFDSAGGYAPTMGIIGTVMGLIQVLGSLSEPTGLGGSIAVAFTATLYGVASANLIFLPIASKIRSRSELDIQTMEMLLEGVLSIQNGENPQLVRKKLETFLPENNGNLIREARTGEE